MDEREIEPLRAKQVCYELSMGLEEAVEHLWVELQGAQNLSIRQSELLTGVVNAIRGEPADDALHSHHDAAELAQRMRKLLDDAHHYVLQAAQFDDDGEPRKYAGDAGRWLFAYHELVGIDISDLLGAFTPEELFEELSRETQAKESREGEG